MNPHYEWVTEHDIGRLQLAVLVLSAIVIVDVLLSLFRKR